MNDVDYPNPVQLTVCSNVFSHGMNPGTGDSVLRVLTEGYFL
jgi:hypothetical protein